MKTPVAFLIFNRPGTTEKVFAAIRQAKPPKLLVVADGPRAERLGEADKCQVTRAIIDGVDWDCQVMTNYSDVNLGCKKRISSGLDWVFSEVEEAIILEDDCLPAPSFFNYCQNLLERYKHDERIMHISGNNFQDGQSRNDFSYYLSKYTHVWGWASWRRAWKYYDVTLKTWPQYKKPSMIGSICESTYEQKYWIDVFENVFNNGIDTWDYQWLYTCWFQSGLSVLPNSNLVSNIGFGSDATHTKEQNFLSQLPTTDIWEMKHPPFILRDRIADTYTFDHHYGGKKIRESNNFISKAKHIIKHIKNSFQQS